METVLTFDIGGTAMRAGLFDTHAKLLKQVLRPSPSQKIKENAAEIFADAWWQTLCELVEELFHDPKIRIADVKGICISGVTRTQIFMDQDGNALRPAITWLDGRATEQAGRLNDRIQCLEPGNAPADQTRINAYHPLARFLWVKEQEPEVYRQTRWVLQPKDYVNYKLTGVAAGDLISSSNLLDKGCLKKPGTLLERLGFDSRVIPPCYPPETRIGTLRDDLPEPFRRMAGVPVVVGSMDGWCSALGIGANRPGFAYDIAGTTEVVGIITRHPFHAPGLVSLSWGDDLFQIGGPTQAGGDCLRWFMEAFCRRQDRAAKEDVSDVLKTLGKGPHDPSSMVFLPYLAGERTPIWDPTARGVFFGVSRRHTASDFLLAVMEGVAFAVRHILDLASDAVPDPIKEIRIAGGGADLDIWCQIKADVTGSEIVRTAQKEAGLFGAALLTLQGLGLYRDRQTMQAELVEDEKRFYPDTRKEDKYAQLYKIYRSLITDLKTRFQELAALRDGDRPDPSVGMDQSPMDQTGIDKD